MSETTSDSSEKQYVLHVLAYAAEGPAWKRWEAEQKPQVTISDGTLSVIYNDPSWPQGWGLLVYPWRNVLRIQIDGSVPLDWPAAPR